MPKVNMFNSISLDGYFTDTHNDMSWAHAGGDDPEMREFTATNAQGGGALVFGRITWQMMAAFWPTPAAAQMMPQVAKGMNAARKYVFSRSLKSADWANTVILDADPAQEMARRQGPDHPGQRQHRQATHCRRPDRRLPVHGLPCGAGRGPHFVRRPAGAAQPEFGKQPYFQERQGVSALPALTRPLAQARGVPRSRKSTGLARALRAPLVTPSTTQGEEKHKSSC
jgi:hypothetical protein